MSSNRYIAVLIITDTNCCAPRVIEPEKNTLSKSYSFTGRSWLFTSNSTIIMNTVLYHRHRRNNPVKRIKYNACTYKYGKQKRDWKRHRKKLGIGLRLKIC